MAFIEIRNYGFAYPSKEEKALDGISLEIEAGEFILLCGESGSGKSTLLRSLKPELSPFGTRQGAIFYCGGDITALDERASASQIGFVMQNPDAQPVTDKVWHELAFGLENLGFEPPVIRRRVAEMASFFGIQGWFRSDVDSLSGGQKQILNLACVMAMQPKLLILDEPTSQLDPVASREFLETVVRLNRELSTTVLLSEHRLEEVFPLADKVAVLERGRLVCFDTPALAGAMLSREGGGHAVSAGLPTPLRVYCALGGKGACPLTIRDGRRWLEGVVGVPEADALPLPERPVHSGTPAVELKEVWFKYDKSAPDVLRGLSFSAWPGELACILGGNATGKTTALSCIAGVRRHYRGSIRIGGRPLSDYRGNELYRGGVALLPQNPQALFNANRLIDDLREVASAQPKERAAALLEQVTAELGLAPLLGANPGDLSGGEQQKAALAKLLLLEPKLLLLDEPTKGLDAQFKEKLAGIFSSLTARGVCLVMVTHDIEFAAQYAHRCAMFFDGGVISEDEPVRFFSGNSFYTTAANRMSRGVFKNAVTSGDVVKLCGLNVKE